MCLNESYTKVRVGKSFLIHFLLRIFLKKDDPLSPTLLHLALEYASKRVQQTRRGWNEIVLDNFWFKLMILIYRVKVTIL